MGVVEVLDSVQPTRAGGWKVDVSRGERNGRVSSEWFNRPDDERYLSLDDLWANVKGRSERSRSRVVQTADIRVEAARDSADAQRLRRAEASGLDLSTLSRRALPDGNARLFARPEDIIPVPEAGAPWRITSRISNGANLRLVLNHASLGEAEADVPRRAVSADALIKGATVRLRLEAGAVFPAGRATAETPSQQISVPPSKEKIR
mgnify:CR=1 FL=1